MMRFFRFHKELSAEQVRQLFINRAKYLNEMADEMNRMIEENKPLAELANYLEDDEQLSIRRE